MATTKTAFEWSSQQQIGMVEVSEKERRMISLCSLDIEREDETEERWYISFSTIKYFKKRGDSKEAWHPIKGYTIPLDSWQDVTKMIDDNVDWGDEGE